MGELDEMLGHAGAPTAPSNGNGGLPVGLPMPRNPEMLFDLGRRTRVTRDDRGYRFPVPNGWFVVAQGSELAVGEVKALHYFDRDLVLFRDEQGGPHLLDAHCMHLGAHLAVGGRVEGDCIRCPFHGWKFEGASGACAEIPYGSATRIPKKANTRAYPTIERNQMIWAWYHAHGEPPFYEVPVVDEFGSDGWSPIECREFEVAVPCQDMAENNVDFAHFRYVHGTDGIPEDEFIVEGTYKRAVGMDGRFVREGYGLGLGVLRITDYVTFLSSTTPIDRENVHVRWVFTAPLANGERGALDAADSFCAGVSQDIPIWENKIYRDPPVLTRTEKLILEHRKWARQFYSDFDDEPTRERVAWTPTRERVEEGIPMSENRWVRQPSQNGGASNFHPSLPSLEVAYFTDPDVLAAVLPPPLTPPDEPRVHARVTEIDLQFGEYKHQERVAYFAVDAKYEGALGEYPLLMPIDLEPAVAISREKFGEPKKLAEIDFARDGDHVEARVTRHGVSFIEIIGDVVETLPTPEPYAARQWWFKFQPAVSGGGFDSGPTLIRVDQVRSPESVERVEGKLVLRELASCPVVDLPIVETESVQWTVRKSTHEPTIVGDIDAVAFEPYSYARYDGAR